jgi:hypothetical protein
MQADYKTQYKVAPEWTPILDTFEQAGGGTSSGSRRSRRRLLQAWSSGSVTGTPLDQLLTQHASGLAPQVAILVSFPYGLLQQGLPQAAARDWAMPLQALLQGSGPRCQPVLTPLSSGVQVAVCPEVREGPGNASTCHCAFAIHLSGLTTLLAHCRC